MPTIPASISHLLSPAGTWTPVGATDAAGQAVYLANFYYAPIALAGGRTGFALDGWAFAGWNNTVFYPVNAALLEQQPDGTLQVATQKYVPASSTQGASSVQVADFNGDGRPDVFLAAHNESPQVAKPSTVWMSNASGGFDSLLLNDSVQAHGTTVATYQGLPTVFASTYGADFNPSYQYVDGRFVQTEHAKSYVAPDGTRFPIFSAMSSALADFDGDGALDIVLGDCGYGPGYPPSHAASPDIVVYRLADAFADKGSPAAILTPYFNGKSQYAGISSYIGPGVTHTYRVWVDDFNHDGKPDVLAGGSLWPSPYSQLQMLQNTSSGPGQFSFADRTDALNTAWEIGSDEVDYSLQMVDIDGSGIDTLFNAGGVNLNRDDQQVNYILLNDGTGRLHTYMHQEFTALAHQIHAWATPAAPPARDVEGRFMEYLTPEGRINLVYVYDTVRKVDGRDVLQYRFVNLPLGLDPASDYQEDVTVADRNGSLRLRTWAGDDLFHDAGAGSAAGTIDGGLGLDTSVYSGARASYTVHRDAGATVSVQSAAGAPVAVRDALRQIERLQFSDGGMAFDIDGHAGQAAKAVGAVFGPAYLDNAGLMGIALDLLDSGLPYAELVRLAVGTQAFAQLAGSHGHADFVAHVYQNLTGSSPPQSTQDALVGLLETGALTQASMALLACETPQNAQRVDLVGLATHGLAYLPAG